jgi:hypothetical protein
VPCGIATGRRTLRIRSCVVLRCCNSGGAPGGYILDRPSGGPCGQTQRYLRIVPPLMGSIRGSIPSGRRSCESRQGGRSARLLPGAGSQPEQRPHNSPARPLWRSLTRWKSGPRIVLRRLDGERRRCRSSPPVPGGRGHPCCPSARKSRWGKSDSISPVLD